MRVLSENINDDNGGHMSKELQPVNSKAINLKDIDPSNTGACDKEKCLLDTTKFSRELSVLQESMYAAQSNGVLIVLQGMDTSGKDGTVSHVFSSVNPQGCAVASFKVPTPQEALHDFLWRAHAHTPSRGQITIFNRSHYEDVLVTRVHKLVDKKVCEQRYEHIRNFEKLLTDNNTIILKFFLHIGKDEQKERLLAREQDASKAWKLSSGDWEERKFWDEYQTAYEDAIAATSTKNAPWYIIPADHKWYRNYIIGKTLVETLSEYKDEWQDALAAMGKARLKELEVMRSGKTNGS